MTMRHRARRLERQPEAGTEAADRVADVLLLFAPVRRTARASPSIARALGLSKAVVHRILQSLTSRSLVQGVPGRRDVRPRAGGHRARHQAWSQLDVRTRRGAGPARLRDQTRETTTLSVLVGRPAGSTSTSSRARRRSRWSSRSGRGYALHSGASSRAILAYLPPDFVDERSARAAAAAQPDVDVDGVPRRARGHPRARLRDLPQRARHRRRVDRRAVLRRRRATCSGRSAASGPVFRYPATRRGARRPRWPVVAAARTITEPRWPGLPDDGATGHPSAAVVPLRPGQPARPVRQGAPGPRRTRWCSTSRTPCPCRTKGAARAEVRHWLASAPGDGAERWVRVDAEVVAADLEAVVHNRPRRDLSWQASTEVAGRGSTRARSGSSGPGRRARRACRGTRRDARRPARRSRRWPRHPHLVTFGVGEVDLLADLRVRRTPGRRPPSTRCGSRSWCTPPRPACRTGGAHVDRLPRPRRLPRATRHARPRLPVADRDPPGSGAGDQRGADPRRRRGRARRATCSPASRPPAVGVTTDEHGRLDRRRRGARARETLDRAGA